MVWWIKIYVEWGIRYHDRYVLALFYWELRWGISNTKTCWTFNWWKIHNPLEANFKDASHISTANNYIETRFDTSKGTFVEAMQCGYVKHHDTACMINAFIDHYAYTWMQDTKQHIVRREKTYYADGWHRSIVC